MELLFTFAGRILPKGHTHKWMDNVETDFKKLYVNMMKRINNGFTTYRNI